MYVCVCARARVQMCVIVTAPPPSFPGIVLVLMLKSNPFSLRAIPFECTWGRGGGVERSPIKKSWGEGVEMKKLGVYMKKNHWGGV